MSAAAFLVDWVLWATSVVGTLTGYAGAVLTAALAVGIVGVARQDWELGRRPFDKINAQ